MENLSVRVAAGAEPAPDDSPGKFERDLAEHVILRSRINVLHPNPQSILDGLQVGFVNVSSANLTFERRDVVVPSRRPVVFSRIYDSRIRANADFGPGWRLSLDESIIIHEHGASYVDGAGARYRFRRITETDYILDPMVPRLLGVNLTVAGTSAVLVSVDGETRTFERAAHGNPFALRRIDWPGGDWIGLTHRDGRFEALFDAEGEIVRVEREAEGRIAAAVDRYRRRVEYSYDGGGRLAHVRDLAGNDWSHEYDAAGRLTSALGVDGEPYLAVEYDAAGRVALSEAERPFAFEYGREFTAVARAADGCDAMDRSLPLGDTA